MNKNRTDWIILWVILGILTIGTAIVSFVVVMDTFRPPRAPLVMPDIHTNDIKSPTIVAEGYLIKSSDEYGRENWKIGTQSVKSTDMFCILSDKNSPSYATDMFSRQPISTLRTDHIYKVYSCQFRQYSSDRPDSWIEKVWGIQAVSDNITAGAQ
jgi:hypothetical protein